MTVDVNDNLLVFTLSIIKIQALSPGPFPAFQRCMLKTCNIEKLGMGLGTRLQ